MAATSGTYIQCGLWRFLGVSGLWADRLEIIQGKGLSDRAIGYGAIIIVSN